jgi:hypothetical protein
VNFPRTLAVRIGSCWKSLRTVCLRPHLSTLVFLMPVLAALVLANVPGWRVVYLSPVSLYSYKPGIDAKYEHGWPLTHLRRRTWDFQTSSASSLAHYSPWDLSHGIIEFRRLALAGNVATSIGILILSGVLIEARRRRRPSCFQFHLRELLVFVTLVAIGLSFYAVRRKEYSEECKIYAWLHRNDGSGEPGPFYDADWRPNGPDWQLEGPDWLLPALGENRYYELFARLCAVETGGDDLKEAVKLRRLLLLRLGPSSRENASLLTQIPTLEAIELMYWANWDQRVELPYLPKLRLLKVETLTGSMSGYPSWRIRGLSGLKSLESLSIADNQFDDTSMADLDGMTHLRCLDLCLSDTKITSAGLCHLQKSVQLDQLILTRTQIDDAALPIIGQMKMLFTLDLSETHITDAGLESLKSLKDLHYLNLSNTAVTAEGVRRLRQALPNCEIHWSPRYEESEEKGKSQKGR